MSEARERRRERAKQQKSGMSVGDALKRFRVPIVILIVAGAVIAYNVAAERGVFGTDAGCPDHWHAGYSVWVEDQKVPFPPTGPAASQEASPAAGFHIHGDDGILHFHPAVERCIPTRDALEKLGVSVASDSLTVRGQTFTENETHQVVVYHQEWEGRWNEVRNVNAFLGRQLGNGDRMMIAFMAENSTFTVDARQQQTTTLAGGNYDPGAAPVSDELFVNVSITIVLAGVAIMVWYSMAKKTW